MNYTHLGRTGLKVSRLCLGTMNFGDVTDERPAPAFWMRRLRRVSISLIQQTCMALNNLPISSKARGCPRKLLVAGFSRVAAVNASFWRQKSISLWGGPNDRRLSAYHIRKACEDSLRRQDRPY